MSSNLASKVYDLIVIGGGSGGLSTAKQAATYGSKVLLCDYVNPSPQGSKWGLGGTCVNVGCIPKKLMHTSALIGDTLHKVAPSYGWENIGAPTCDWDTLRGNVNMHIRSLNFGYLAALRKSNVDYLNAYARFIDSNNLEFTHKNGTITTATAKHILLATGGRPSYPDIPGAKEYGITSDDIFNLKTDPKKTLIVGGSYVALECAGFLHGIGRPTSVMMRSIPLRGFDTQMSRKVVDYMEESGISIQYNCVPTSLTKNDNGTIKVTYQDTYSNETNSKDYDTVLFAVGRKPETHNIGIDKAGVQLTSSGRVIVNQFDQTSVDHIYAIGDIIEGGAELTPVAIQAGKLLANRLYNGETATMNYRTVPTTVFTPLEYGCVGLSEDEAITKYSNIEVYHSQFKPLEWSLPHIDFNCYLKIIVDASDNQRVIGFHILSPNAGEITQGVALAVTMGLTKEHLDNTIGIHPTIAEGMTTLTITKSSGLDADNAGC